MNFSKLVFVYKEKCAWLQKKNISLFSLLMNINVTALPIAPTDLRISEVTATTVRLEWSYKGTEDLQYYVLQHKPKNANQVSFYVCLCLGKKKKCSAKVRKMMKFFRVCFVN